VGTQRPPGGSEGIDMRKGYDPELAGPRIVADERVVPHG
jgi:hypothetical protein